MAGNGTRGGHAEEGQRRLAVLVGADNAHRRRLHMNSSLLALAATLALSGAAGPVHAAEYEYLLSAGELRSAIDQGHKNMATGYIAGVLDTLMRSRDFCVPEGETATLVGSRVFIMMSQQPRESKAPAADVIAVFVLGDYPCRK